MQDEAIYVFGPFALDPRQRVLSHGGAPLRLTPKEIDVLLALVERHGEIVEKRSLLAEIWPGVCVEECNLSQHVASLRRVLGDDAREPTYIETVARRGYRFVSPVVRAPPPSKGADGAGPAARSGRSFDAATGWRFRPRLARAVAALLVLAILALGAWSWFAANHIRPSKAIRSLAVLPLANLTGDAHQDEVATAMTTDLMRELRRVKGLRVQPTHSLPEGGHAVVGADALVETALLSGEGRVRLAAELIDERTGQLLWADVLESEPVAREKAGQQLVKEVVAHLAAREGDEGERALDTRAVARRELDLAHEYLERWTAGVVPEAIEHYTAAVRADPRLAPALAGLAEAYLFGAEQRVLEPGPAVARAEEAARRALELDPRLAEAHGALGGVAAARWNFVAAEEEYRRAIALDPSVGEIRAAYAALLTIEDRHEEAIAQARVARDLDPDCPVTVNALAAAHYHAGRIEEAVERALATLRVTPGYAAAYDILGWAHEAKGRNAEAVAAFREAVRLSEGNPAYVAGLARALARGGDREEARRLTRDLETRRHGKVTSPLDLAAVYAALGENERAVREVERAVAEGTPWLQQGDSGVSLAGLHEQAGFRTLMERLRKAAAWPAGEVAPEEARVPAVRPTSTVATSER